MPTRLPDAIFSPSGVAARPGHVLRKADVIFRSGDYDFPVEQGGTFSMTPDDIKAALADFAPVDLEDTHAPSVFNGKLGRLVKTTPSANFDVFGGEVEIPEWFDSLFKGQPIKLSARWDRTTKRLKKLAVVPEGRVPDAAMFAAFSAAYPPAADPNLTPMPAASADSRNASVDGGDVVEKTAHGIAALISAALQDTSLPETARKQLTQMAQMCDSMCAPPEPPPATTIPPAPNQGDAPMSAEVAALQAEIKALKDANFEAKKDKFRAEGRTFAHELFRAGKITPAEAPNVTEAYFQAAMDDHAHPTTDVCFSDDKGNQAKGTRLHALKAMLLNQPSNGLTQELTGDGKVAADGDALFNRTTTADAGPKRMTPEAKDKYLSHTDLGKAILRDRKTANGAR